MNNLIVALLPVLWVDFWGYQPVSWIDFWGYLPVLWIDKHSYQWPDSPTAVVCTIPTIEGVKHTKHNERKHKIRQNEHLVPPVYICIIYLYPYKYTNTCEHWTPVYIHTTTNTSGHWLTEARFGGSLMVGWVVGWSDLMVDHSSCLSFVLYFYSCAGFHGEGVENFHSEIFRALAFIYECMWVFNAGCGRLKNIICDQFGAWLAEWPIPNLLGIHGYQIFYAAKWCFWVTEAKEPFIMGAGLCQRPDNSCKTYFELRTAELCTRLYMPWIW